MLCAVLRLPVRLTISCASSPPNIHVHAVLCLPCCAVLRAYLYEVDDLLRQLLGLVILLHPAVAVNSETWRGTAQQHGSTARRFEARRLGLRHLERMGGRGEGGGAGWAYEPSGHARQAGVAAFRLSAVSGLAALPCCGSGYAVAVAGRVPPRVATAWHGTTRHCLLPKQPHRVHLEPCTGGGVAATTETKVAAGKAPNRPQLGRRSGLSPSGPRGPAELDAPGAGHGAPRVQAATLPGPCPMDGPLPGS